jgi:hypothetical protein
VRPVARQEGSGLRDVVGGRHPWSGERSSTTFRMASTLMPGPAPARR